MTLKTASPEELAAGQDFLRATVKPSMAESRNVAIAADPEAISYFYFKGTHFKAPPLDHRIGIQMQEVMLEIRRLGEREKDSFETDEEQHNHLEHLVRCYQRAVDLFHQACEPVAFYKRWFYRRKNPFQGCSGGEIGDLIHFFSGCRTKSRVRLLASSVTRQSLSMLMQPTTSPTS